MKSKFVRVSKTKYVNLEYVRDIELLSGGRLKIHFSVYEKDVLTPFIEVDEEFSAKIKEELEMLD